MNKTGFFKLFVSYLRRNLKFILLSFCFALIFWIVFALYNFPTEAVGYAVLLCFCVGIIFLAFDFSQYYRRHQWLEHLKNVINVSISDLPAPIDMIEQDYHEIITIIHRDKIKIATHGDISRREIMDYYTLWAHQIKTPIAAMHLLLQSDEHHQNSELSLELFKIEQYVELVLQYLRLETMSSDLVLKRYSLDHIIKQAIRKYAKMFIQKKISLNYTSLNCDVLTDEKWLVFVIEQILSNALKYTHTGSISIYMDQSAEKTLVIEDTGIGIAEEDLPRIFEKGFTGYNGRSDKKSTGIGLYLCAQILTKLSHTIVIESEVDKGSKVMIDLATLALDVE